MRRVITLILLAAMSAGCSGFSIYREFSIDESPNTSTVIDSKQREVISFKKDGRTVVCSEPSPDTFSAIGQALSASSVFSPMTKEVSLALSMALAESAGTIQRAKSVQLLRDGLYAACLGYANGLSTQQYDRLLLRQLSAAVVLMGIESVTPQASPPPITLHTEGAALTAGSPKTEPPQADPPGKKPDNNPSPTESGKEKTSPSGGNESKSSPSTKGKTENTPSSRLGVGNHNSSFYRVLIADQSPSSEESQNPSSNDEVGNTDENEETSEETDTDKEKDANTGDSSSASPVNPLPTPTPLSTSAEAKGSSSSPGNPLALPAPTDEAVKAVQYMVSTFLHDAMAFECVDQVIALEERNPNPEKSSAFARDLMDVCLTVVQSVAYRGAPVESPQDGEPKAKLPSAQKGKEESFTDTTSEDGSSEKPKSDSPRKQFFNPNLGRGPLPTPAR